MCRNRGERARAEEAVVFIRQRHVLPGKKVVDLTVGAGYCALLTDDDAVR